MQFPKIDYILNKLLFFTTFVCLYIVQFNQAIAQNNNQGEKNLNRLANESSPYLLQHKNNPVDWYPWGKEAFNKALELDRPIFLSIGYSTCHWCHVMEEESFEDEEVAKLLSTCTW